MKFMENSEILVSLSKTIAESQEIKNYCQGKYEKDHTVFVGINADSPPEDFPAVALYAVEKTSYQESDRYINFLLSIGVAVENENVDVIDNRKILTGMIEAEELRQIVEKVIFKAEIATITNIDGNSMSQVFFPNFSSDSIIELKFLRSNRKLLK